jgi:hypothetical protein
LCFVCFALFYHKKSKQASRSCKKAAALRSGLFGSPVFPVVVDIVHGFREADEGGMGIVIPGQVEIFDPEIFLPNQLPFAALFDMLRFFAEIPGLGGDVPVVGIKI